MDKYRVLCGEFEIIINEQSPLLAGKLAMKVHERSRNSKQLGQLTMISTLDDDSVMVGDALFFSTETLAN